MIKTADSNDGLSILGLYRKVRPLLFRLRAVRTVDRWILASRRARRIRARYLAMEDEAIRKMRDFEANPDPGRKAVEENAVAPRTVIGKHAWATIEINNTCNIDCLSCKPSLSTRKKGRMEDETLVSSLAGLKELGVTTVALHTIGDPLANPRLRQVMARLREYGIRTWISTNGMLLERHLQTFAEYPDVIHSQVRISIDGGTREIYERIRRGASWDKLHENIKLFNDRLGPEGYELYFKMIVTQANVAGIGQFIDTFGKYVKDKTRLEFNLANSLSPDNQYFEETNLFPEFTHLNTGCSLVRDPVPYILVDGKVSVCCRDYDGSLVIGNLGGNLLELNEGAALHELREAHDSGDLGDYPLCNSCYIVDKRIQVGFSQLLAILLHRHPQQPGAFFQSRVDDFIAMFAQRGASGIAPRYRQLLS